MYQILLPRLVGAPSCYFKLYCPFLWMGFNCLKAAATSKGQFTFYHSVPRNSWYSFYRPRKDERLSQPWSHPVVLIYPQKCSLFKTQSMDKVSMSYFFSFPRYQTKCVIKFIFRQLMMSYFNIYLQTTSKTMEKKKGRWK